jgi:hypothetical protein
MSTGVKAVADIPTALGIVSLYRTVKAGASPGHRSAGGAA